MAAVLVMAVPVARYLVVLVREMMNAVDLVLPVLPDLPPPLPPEHPLLLPPLPVLVLVNTLTVSS